MITLYVDGLGVSAPALGDASAPRSTLLTPALRRRASALTLLVSEALAQAASGAGVAVSDTPLLLGSAYGEIGSAIQMMAEFESDGLPSPTRFHNSVHNAAVSYASIASRNRGFTTAVAAGPDTVAMTLVEAAALLHERGEGALLVLADEPVPAPFTPARPWTAAAAAFHVSERPTAATCASLSALRKGASPRWSAPGLDTHPCAGAFAIADAIRRGVSGPVSLGGSSDGWIVDVRTVRR